MANYEADSTGIDSSTVRVLIENGEYWLTNRGDLAILDVTVRRLSERWPGARLGVLTYAPSLLRAFAPSAEPVTYRRGSRWARSGPWWQLPAYAGPQLVGPVSEGWWAASDRPRRYARRVRDSLRGSVAVPDETGRIPRIPMAVRDASLVLAMGGGYMTDVDPYQAHRTLDLLECAADLQIPTAMCGQGIGPLTGEHLVAHASHVLPKVDLIAVREGVRGPALLRSLGVSSERIVVTGDDAVELAYDMRSDPIGTDIGVCLRVAGYSQVTGGAQDVVGRVVRGFAGSVDAGLVPLIVSEYEAEDRRSTMPLVDGFPVVRSILGRFASARDLVAEVARCRVLVTGAYHVAVFALAQGIPVVGLSTSRYYDDKLGGLSGMFPGGVELVQLAEDGLEERLTRAVHHMWQAAPDLRSGLRAEARAQVCASRRAFERVYALVESENPRRATEQ
ncbi:polysaccharide pyruvyl transferase family protein [Rhodococcus opacus]|uniref:Polysaccharide pyruvyl transferase family protein n=1 Tax=Rhodococcus opacus TaxID=37919 RepID=A0AAX3YJI5_RHOOP|nr:polysaccharide pyruvyl transferase family protein [Rhodococcus opacus]MCZ4582196.1 polysaccharide pyruvyl transferase family protein [Rhodococcus opacus]WLF49368.1 polysaccharide pyruvyl transferase family protein [Rhodococcus opacus]